MFALLRFLFTGWMLKILLLLALIAALYYFHIWPFRQNVASVPFLEKKYCEKSDREKQAICDCIVVRLKADIEKRFSRAELDSMEEDRLKMAYVLEKSLQKIMEPAQACLKEAGQPQAWEVFVSDLASLDNEALKKVGNAMRSGADYLKDQWNSRSGEKKEIDEHY